MADVNLSGTILWTDGGGNTHPVREATVEIWDSNAFFPNQLVTTVRTDVNGEYSATFNNNEIGFPELFSNRDIYIKVLADSPFHYVSSDGTRDNTYSKQSQTFNEIPNGANTIDLTISSTTNAERAFSVSDALYTSELYAKTLRGNPPLLQVRFPVNATEAEDNNQTSFYANGQINILLSDRWDWDVINHEYGHFLAENDSLAKLPLPGGKHIFGVSNIPALGKENGVQLAWSEGLANYLGIAAQNVANTAGELPSVFNENGTSSTGDTFYTETIQQTFTIDLEGMAGSGNGGEGDESSVMRILWDIADDNQDTFTNGLTDNITLGNTELYEILNNNIPNLDQLDDVWDYFYGISDDATRVNYGAIFEEYDVSPAPLNGPIGQTFQLGSSIPTFQWVENNNNANDQFQVIVFNNDFSTRELDYLVQGNVTQWTPTQEQWAQIIDSPGDYQFVIAGSDTDVFSTGSYWSGAYDFFVTSPPQIIVTTLEDEDDGNLSPNDISLREAIRFTEPGGTINFDPNLAGGTITLTQGELKIEEDLTIEGLGADQLTVSGNNVSRVFRIDDGEFSNTLDVQIDGLTIANGLGDEFFGGGGILNEENLTVTNSTISNNSSERFGGGILNSGNLTLTNSTISGNFAPFAGGGIFSGGTEGLVNTLTIINSTISGNQTNGEGGGIWNGVTSTLVVNSSTITNNEAIDGGGIVSSTVITGPIDGTIGGTAINNTIIAGNSGGNHPDVSGNFDPSRSSFNLIGIGTDSNFNHGDRGNIVGTSDQPIAPELGSLQDNGGPTFTHALLNGSPAIDAANPNANVLIDQRGVTRPQRDGFDIGAFETTDSLLGVTRIGTSNDDSLKGGAGNDFIEGFNSQDTLEGFAGNDSLDGGDGDDMLFGGQDDDTLLGGGAQDQLFGDNGDDLLNGGQGDNILTGGADKDIFILSTEGKNTIVDFEDGQDLLKLNGGLTFESLSIFEQNGDTWIATNNSQPLAFLTAVDANLISAEDFTTV